ncbi:DNA-binding transcriptional LysR family regulator [Pullulanibacillus pueri]|uniref:Putative HTH-type transcriptional regulator YraN n=1 Tax=Pullulanibacillus pueri TaxID=1437324 RepID=A0A8J3A360_9BACL|nr:LysR family transcriptional regulator [Pullulanibacillus pueri]MBM7684093.1 DNA-binding transcriptional LysR family regulator [Pullulanibacillus pueri]GGH88636.1 putative HTH-type transcriptional regulator YraN [Pullulanibacillus pueri]
MNEKDWILLSTLFDEGSITKTAQKLYISQPALTYRIKQIEKEFHSEVIKRSKNGVTFTNEGEYLVNYARTMIKELRKAKDNIINMKEEVHGTLRLGVSSNFALYQLPLLLEGFLAEYPNVEINLTTGWSPKIHELLEKEEIHIGISRGEHHWSGERIVLNEETLCVASKDKLHINDLPKLSLIRYQTDFHLKNTFDEWWQSSFNVPPKVSMEVDRIETCKELVKKGLGYALFPSISLRESDHLYTADLVMNNKKILRRTWLLYRKELLGLNIIKAFVRFTKAFYLASE